MKKAGTLAIYVVWAVWVVWVVKWRGSGVVWVVKWWRGGVVEWWDGDAICFITHLDACAPACCMKE